MPYSLTDMTLYFFLYSLFGWLMETVLCSVRERRFVNRGFLNGPICPIYGCGSALILILLLPVRDGVAPLAKAALVIFLSGAALATGVEYAVSWLMEKLFHARWWDYSHMKMNINGRVSLMISLSWGGLATIFLYWLQPLAEQLVSAFYATNAGLPGVAAAAFAAVFILDMAVSTLVALRIHHKLDQFEKWAEIIRGFTESLELPTKEDILRRLESGLDKLTERSRRASPASDLQLSKAPEWNGLSFDALRRRLSEYVEELNLKRRELMQGTRLLQRRMLRAFPRMSRSDQPVSLRDWKEILGVRRGGKPSGEDE